MPITTEITPHEIRVNLSTPGCPVTLLSLSQQVLIEGDTRTPVGPISMVSQELSANDQRLAQHLGSALASALAEAERLRLEVAELTEPGHG